MIVFVLRSGETPSRVDPEMMVNAMWREETCNKLLLLVSVVVRLVCALTGSLALVLIWLNWLKQRLCFLNHESTLLNLLPNCLHDLRGCCPKWFFGLRDRILTSASQRSCGGVGPSPELACP